MGMGKSIIDKNLSEFMGDGISSIIDGIDIDQTKMVEPLSEVFTQQFLKDSQGNLVKNEAVHNIMHRFIRFSRSKGYNRFLLGGSFGHGKSLIRGSKILMYDCTLKKVEDVHVGDLLMGPDSRPRRVLFLGNGIEPAYRITLPNGDFFDCNESHKLSLKVTRDFWGFRKGEILTVLLTEYFELPKWLKSECLKMYKVPLEFDYQEVKTDPYEYGCKIGNFRVQHKDIHTQFYKIWAGMKERCNNPNVQGYHCYGGRGISHDPRWSDYLEFKKDMYFKYLFALKNQKVKEPSLERVNVNGHYCFENCIFIELKNQQKNQRRSKCNRHIPDVDLNYFQNHDNDREYYENFDDVYLRNSREVRLQVLAGFLDAHGTKPSKKFKMYRVKIKENDKFRDDLLFLCRSLGFSVNWVKVASSKNAFSYCISITGNIDQIPCRINTIGFKFNKYSYKDPLIYSFKIKSIGEKEYFGIGVDKDHLYLHHDLTCLRNTEQLATGFVMHEIAKNPNILIKMVHVSETEAVKRCRALRDYIQKDDDIHRIAPHLLPTPIWGSQRFTVKRNAMSKDGTVEAYGVLSTAIGGRANLIVFDDPQDLKTAVLEPSTRKRIEDTIKNIWLTRLIPQDSEVLLMMNKWSDNDLISVFQRNPQWAWMTIEVSEDLTHLIFKDSFCRRYRLPLWSKFNRNDLMTKLRELGKRDFDRGYRLVAYSDTEKTFPSFEKCCHFGINPTKLIEDENNWLFIGGIDFASMKRPGTVLTIVAANKKSGMKVPVEVVLLKGSSELPFWMVKFFQKYGVDLFMAENNGVQDSIIDLLVTNLGQEKFQKYGIKIEGFLTGRNKTDPIHGLPSLEKEFENQEWMFCFQSKPDVTIDNMDDPWIKTYFEFLNYPFYDTTDIVMSMWMAREAVKKFFRNDMGPQVY